MPRRDDLPPVERAVSDVLDDLLHRHHGIQTSWSNPEDFIALLRDEGYEVVPVSAPVAVPVDGR